jgi:2-dehydropantoate 2-reductase
MVFPVDACHNSDVHRISNIAVIGVGGVGGYFGGKLCKLLETDSGCTLSFVARGEHLQAVQRHGLLLHSDEGDLICKPSLATNDFRQLPPLDLCLLCVKEFDLAFALSKLVSVIRDHTVILPLLNGVDVPARVRRVIKNGILLPACVYVGTHIEKAGVIFQKGGACKILFGPDPLYPSFTADEILRLFGSANIKCEWTDDIQAEIWKKFVFICAYGLVTAAFDKTVGEVLENESLRTDAQNVINEAIRLASASGVRLPNDTAENALLKARSFPYEAKTSFQRDFEQPGRRDERDLFGGAMIRLAAEFQIPVPTTRRLAALLEKRKPFTTK